VTVQKVLQRGVIVQHDSGLRGFISIERFSDSYEQGMRPEDFPLTEKVGQFQAIPTRVVELIPDNLFPAKPDNDGQVPRKGFPLQLTCRTADLQDPLADKSTPPEYGRQEDYELTQKKKLPSKKKRQVAMRSIDHPLWHNVDGMEATKLLESQECGEVIVRPGSSTQDLKITWKFAPNVFVHINVKEEGKEAAKTIGTKLIIADTEYDDLDEIIAMYIEPRVDLSKQMMAHRKYKDVPESESKLEMIAEKDQNEASIPYMLSASHEFPGRFCLTYCTKKGKAIIEYVMCMQDGYKFKGKLFDTVENLLGWFKKNYKDLAGAASRAASSSRTKDRSGRNTPSSRTPSGRSGSRKESRSSRTKR